VRADAEAVRVVRPDGIWSRESADARRARVNAALGTESVDARGLGGNHIMRFLMAGWREKHDYAGRLIALHPPDPSSVQTGPIQLRPPPITGPERPYRGECLAPGCHKEVRRAGDRFCGSPECREWAQEAHRAHAREIYHQDPKAANARRAAEARAKRLRDRTARTVRRFCFVDSHPFTTTDPKRRVCLDPEHQARYRRDLACLRQARFRRRHRTPKRLRIRTKPYRGKARFIVTEALATA
jgi:hypothetical protein